MREIEQIIGGVFDNITISKHPKNGMLFLISVKDRLLKNTDEDKLKVYRYLEKNHRNILSKLQYVVEIYE